MKLIVADTTNMNTGSKNGIAIQLQRPFSQKKLEEAQFIGCQHHVLARVSRVVRNNELGGNNTSHSNEYPFIHELVNNYEQLKKIFKNGKEEIIETSEWHDNMEFLFHLTRGFRHFKETRIYPKVKIKKIPNIKNAR